MKEFNRTTLSQLRADMNAALKAVAEKHGVLLSVGSCTYARDGSEASFKLQAVVKKEGVETMKDASNAKLVTAWKEYASMFGLKQEWLDKSFVVNGKTYMIQGLNTRKHKYPVVTKCLQDSKQYIFSTEDVGLRMN